MSLMHPVGPVSIIAGPINPFSDPVTGHFALTPSTLIPATLVGPLKEALTVLVTIGPLSFIEVSIEVVSLAMATELTLVKASQILSAIREDHSAEVEELVVLEVAFV